MKTDNPIEWSAFDESAPGRRFLTRCEVDSGFDRIEVHSADAKPLQKVRIRVRGFPGVSEIFPVTPNFNDVRRIPGWLQAHQGIRSEHSDQLFGPQWIFTPAPLVFPMLCAGAWVGVGLGAAPGENQYVGWTCRPAGDDGDLILDVFYEGHWGKQGLLFTLYVPTVGKSTPQEVIADYSEWLRAEGWAPRPRRTPAAWWRRPFMQTWGEQCNLLNARGIRVMANNTPGEIGSFDTQSNEMRWYGRLDEKGIPLGVASLGDKWQLSRHRLVPDPARFPDLRAYADWHHRAGRHLVAWLGMWRHDEAPAHMCILNEKGERLSLDPESPTFRKQLQEDVTRLISPEGYDFDGFFLDFTAELPAGAAPRANGARWGVELLHEYVRLIHEAAKAAKPDAMILSHCCHPYFADVIDVLRLNDYCFKNPTVVEQMRYRAGIAKATSDWLINTDGWCMYDIGEWRKALRAAPEIGIPASWFTHGVFGEGSLTYEAFTGQDYAEWKDIWTRYLMDLKPDPRGTE
jgi:hypothetical protein